MKRTNPSPCCRLLLMLAAVWLSALTGMAQSAYQRTIHGIVVDENNEPLPTATVKQVPQSTNESIAGVITDLNGHFSLTLPKSTQEIEVSFVGYETLRVRLTSEADYILHLQPATELLDEVIVTGYQTISKERTTGAFSKINAN